MPDMFDQINLGREKIDYSIVIPVYNEEESLEVLFAEVLQTVAALGHYEIIFVDDCSSDRSPAVMEDFKKKFPEVVRIVRLPQRSGQTLALRKGLEAVKGDVAVTLDADLQNDPADIPKMVEKLKTGYDCVCGWRKRRQDTFLKAVLSKFGNILQRLLSGTNIHDVSCTLRVYRRECIHRIALNWEGEHRFIPLSLSLQGFKIGEVISNHRERKFGKTKYHHKRIFQVIGDFFKVLRAKGKK